MSKVIRVGNTLYREAAKVWYHGDTSKRTTFDDQALDRGPARDKNAMGPGIYFTSDQTEAEGYAPSGYLYTCAIAAKGKRLLTAKVKPDAKLIQAFIKLCGQENLEIGLANWGERDEEALSQAVEVYKSDTSLMQAFLGIYTDFYRRDFKRYASALIKVGFDAYLREFDDRQHLIVFNPSVIKIIAESKM